MQVKKLAVLCSFASLSFVQPAVADITVGVSLSATGPGASLGIPEKNVFALLPTQIAGEKIHYIVLDDATDPSIATKNARKLVTESSVDVLVGSSTTPATAAMAEVATESGTPQVAISPVSLPGDRNKWVFRTPQQNSVMADALLAHMKATGVKTLGFIGFSDAYGEDWLGAVKSRAEATGIKMVAVERYARADTSVSGQVLKLVAARPDAVLVVGSGSPAALPQTTLGERGYKGQIYQTHAAASQAFLKVAGKAAEGVIMPVGPVVVVDQVPDTHPSKTAGHELVRKYEAAYGAGSFSSFAGHAFDAFRLIEQAIPVALKAARPGTPQFRAALRDAIESNKEVVGSHGVFNMSPADHFGLDERSHVLVKIESGAYKMIPQ
ncbi:ABC transporter substrate-binding protein [Aromatoleum anaerobium]|uniref:ABC transporter substrate-binding protein n=1 Tax=Aromatoleum anaerobium TaxID=182180 RepID=A0ABX1PK98_9RHOO|nr:ABC transporter substrate-binding protein [Aromatoleum anaerobium]MCK0506175.1 ABC transporter substrate-binding protein [Aromatoleum anaerobium]